MSPLFSLLRPFPKNPLQNVIPKDVEGEQVKISARSYDGNNYSEVVSITIIVKGVDETSGEGLIPGFEVGAITVVFGLIVCVRYWMKRKEN
jgi:hypothetical protein